MDKLYELLRTAKQGYAQMIRRFDANMAQRLTASLHRAERVASTAHAALHGASAAGATSGPAETPASGADSDADIGSGTARAATTLPFALLAEVYDTSERLRANCDVLQVPPPAEPVPKGALPPAETVHVGKAGRRAQRVAAQEAEAVERDRHFRPTASGNPDYDVHAGEDYRASSGGFAELYERSAGTQRDRCALLRGFETQVLEVRRVAKVTRGGTNLRYRALVAIGNRRGVGGLGEQKAPSVRRAIARATRKARRTLVHVPIRHGRTLPHASRGKFEKCLVEVRPLHADAGLRCNYTFCSVLEMIGVRDAGAKRHGARNTMNSTKALFHALSRVRAPEDVMAERGLAVTNLAAFVERRLGDAGIGMEHVGRA